MTHRMIGKVPRKRKRSRSRTPAREADVSDDQLSLTDAAAGVMTADPLSAAISTNLLLPTPPASTSNPLLALPRTLLESVLRYSDYCSLQQLSSVCPTFHSTIRLTPFSASVLRAYGISLPLSLPALHCLHHGSKQQRYQALHNPLFRALFAVDATLQQYERYMDTWRRMKGEIKHEKSKAVARGHGHSRWRVGELRRPWERGWRALRSWVKEEDASVYRWLWGETPVIVSTSQLHTASQHRAAFPHVGPATDDSLPVLSLSLSAGAVRRPHVVHRPAASPATASAPLLHHPTTSLLTLQRIQTTQALRTHQRSRILPHRQPAAAGRGAPRGGGGVWLAFECV